MYPFKYSNKRFVSCTINIYIVHTSVQYRIVSRRPLFKLRLTCVSQPDRILGVDLVSVCFSVSCRLVCLSILPSLKSYILNRTIYSDHVWHTALRFLKYDLRDVHTSVCPLSSSYESSSVFVPAPRTRSL